VTDAQGGTAVERLIPAPISGIAVLVLVLVAALLLREVADLAVPLLCGGFLALLASPLLRALERVGLPSPVAVALTTLVVLAIVIAGAAIVVLSLAELVGVVSTYEDRLLQLVESLRAMLSELGVGTDRDTLLSAVSPEELASQVQGVATSVSNAGAAVVVIALTMVFALAGATRVQARAERVLGPDHPVVAGAIRFSNESRRFLLVRAQLGLFAAILSFVLLLVLGLPLPALWASLVFAASFIPNVGALLALIPPTILAFLEGGIGTALVVTVGYGAINFLQDNLMQPIALGSELNLAPLVAFVGFITWTWVFGAAGAILAIPLTVALTQILEAFPTTHELSILMRNEAGEGEESADQPGAAPADA
jgi:predicted PurR-regulated permease PerM